MRYTALVFLSGLFCALAVAQDKNDRWETHKREHFRVPASEEIERIAAALPDRPTAMAKDNRRILVFYHCYGFIHSSIPLGNAAIEQMGIKTGAFTADFCDDYDVFADDNLEKYDCILLNNTSHMEFKNPEQMNAFIDFVVNGKGLVGFHAAGDNFNRHPECLALVGGTFNGHPWGAGGTWAFKLDDPNHPINAAFQGKGFWHKDEIYQYKPESFVGTGKLRILISLDMTKEKVAGRIQDGPREVPVSWIQTAGTGRVFYTNFGHNESTYQTPSILRHMLDGIQYAIGDLAADGSATDIISVTPALALEPHKP